jgi:hypothetical protein
MNLPCVFTTAGCRSETGGSMRRLPFVPLASRNVYCRAGAPKAVSPVEVDSYFLPDEPSRIDRRTRNIQEAFFGREAGPDSEISRSCAEKVTSDITQASLTAPHLKPLKGRSC